MLVLEKIPDSVEFEELSEGKEIRIVTSVNKREIEFKIEESKDGLVITKVSGDSISMKQSADNQIKVL